MQLNLIKRKEHIMKVLTRTIWTEEDYEFLKNNYLELTNRQIGEKIGKTKSAIQNKLKILGLNRPEKNIYNHDFFENINSKEKAYWLGFIYADGYISKSERSYCCGIELKESDIGHLIKFNKSIGGNIKPSSRKRENELLGETNLCCIRLYSKKMFFDLKKHGCVERKSDKIRMPDIDKRYMWDFIRGYFDGDGCVVLDKSRLCPQFDFCSSSLLMLEEIKTFLFSYGIYSHIQEQGKYNKKIKNKIPNYRLYICGMENGNIFAKYLYSDATIFLDRKYYKWLNIAKEYNIENRINNRKHGGVRHKIKS